MLVHRRSGAEPVEVRPVTHVYKKVGPLAIKADVYRQPDDRVRPAAVWIHGGALIMGHRAQIDRRVKQHMTGAGYVLISLDYRLAPETKLPEIIQDLEAAFAWIRLDGPQLFKIDPARIAVIGGSAGGYLTLASGFRVEPPPTVLMSLWGYGDLIGDWYKKPSSHPRHNERKVTREKAYGQESGPAISDSRYRNGDGGLFYQYCRQTGTWPKEVAGWDPRAEAQRFRPFMPIENVTAAYPPTVLIHGTEDTDVPYEQSKMMAERFKQHNVSHELISVPEAEHGLAGADSQLVESAYAKAFAFVDRHLRVE
ncbi:MAG TPA: alpha/beta hydrolase [Lacipirellulaceae bacterium]|nr:alpha/beta hydrolase [Lacipirellulaceae bacterium]